MRLTDVVADRAAYLRYIAAGQSDNSLQRERLCAATYRAMRQELTGRQYEALRLHYLEGMNQRQIAAQWGVSPSAVCRHLARAKKHLQRLLAYQL